MKTLVSSACLAILAIDTALSLAAKTWDFEYGDLWPLSFAIYLVVGFLAGRVAGRLAAGALAGLAVAMTEATLGWAISWAIGPGRPAPGDRGAGMVIATAVTVAAAGAALGLVGAAAGRRSAGRA